MKYTIICAYNNGKSYIIRSVTEFDFSRCDKTMNMQNFSCTREFSTNKSGVYRECTQNIFIDVAESGLYSVDIIVQRSGMLVSTEYCNVQEQISWEDWCRI